MHTEIMKKIIYAAAFVIAATLLCVCAFADNTYKKDFTALEVESAREWVDEPENSKKDDNTTLTSQNASLYAYFDGEGTSEDPYLIYDATELVLFADGINSGKDTKAHYKLMNNIDLEGQTWTPVGYWSSDFKGDEYKACFSGVFDGNGYTISNFNIISAERAYVGFFGFIYNGTVKNLTLSDFEINVNSEYNALYAGSVVGRCIAMGAGKNISLENCAAENASITATSSGSVYVGGLAGYVMSSDSSSESFVKGCMSDVTVFAMSETTVSGEYSAYAGGLIGYTAATVDTALTIENCMSKGFVQVATALGESCEISGFGGGLCGFTGVDGTTSFLHINECYSLSDVYVECTSAGHVGGIASYAAGVSGQNLIENCYAATSVSGRTYCRAPSENNYMIIGMLVGAIEPNVSVSSCFTSGSAEDLSSEDSYVGALVGLDFLTLKPYYYPFGTNIKNSFYASDVVVEGLNVNRDGATAVTEANASNPETYTGFDFETVWKLYENGYKYPVLRDVEHILKISFIASGKLHENMFFKYGDALAFPKKNPASYTEGRYEFVFKHWALAEYGDPVLKDTVVIDNISLYAVFECRDKQFNFVFMNGQDVFETQIITYGGRAQEPARIPEKTSDLNFWYKFKYWSLTKDGSDKTPVSEIAADNDRVFYAVYEAFDHSAWNGKDTKEFSAGIGTKARPYEIASGYELYYLAVKLAEGDSELAGAYYELCADIELAGNEWLPIGTQSTPFAGVFDGNGYSIKNFCVTESQAQAGLFGVANQAQAGLFGVANQAQAGLFGVANQAQIGRFGIEGAVVEVTNENAIVNAGVVVGTLLDGCTVNEISIKESKVSAESLYDSNAGGVVGRITAETKTTISDCTLSVEVKAKSEQNAYVGGALGYAENVQVSNCYSVGDVNSDATKAYGGGVAGLVLESSTITGCFALGNVKIDAMEEAVAGNISASEGYVDNCYYYSQMSVSANATNANVVTEGGEAESSDLRNEDFLSQNLGFDFEKVWLLSEGYSYPQLAIGAAEKPVFEVSDVAVMAGSVSLNTTVRIIDGKAFRIVVSVYSERGRLIGIKTLELSEKPESELYELPVTVDNVKDAKYIKVTVLDEAARTLLFPAVNKML